MSDNTNTALPKEIQGEEMNIKSQSQQYKYDAFISYRNDTAGDKAHGLYWGLSYMGCRIYNYQFKKEAGDIYRQIDEGIKSSQSIIIIISKDDCLKEKKDDNNFFLHEISESIKQGKKIIPVYYDGIKYEDVKDDIINSKSSKYDIGELSKIVSIDFNKSDPEGSLNQIYLCLKGDVGGSKIEAVLSELKQQNTTIKGKVSKNMHILRKFAMIISTLIVLCGIFVVFINHCKGNQIIDSINENNQTIDSINKKIEDLRNEKDPIIIFAGGGSVANMIHDMTGGIVDVRNYKYGKAIYLDMPTEKAWYLLVNESKNNHAERTNTNRYYPVCLSAEKLPEEELSKFAKDDITKRELMEAGTVIEYELGKDPLLVYVKKELESYLSDTISKKMSTQEFLSLIDKCKRDSLTIFSTDQGSGTYSKYKELIVSRRGFAFFNSLTFKFYNDNSNTNHFVNNSFKNYIVLSSKYYSPKEFTKKDGYTIVSMNPDSFSKKLYLYFAAYTIRENDNEKLMIPEPMKVFLNILSTYNKHQKIDCFFKAVPYNFITGFKELKSYEKQ